MIQETTQTIHPSAQDLGTRLDRFLATYLPEMSRTRIKSLIEAGYLSAGNQIIKDCSASVKLGTEYKLTIPPPVSTDIIANPIALAVIYEDDYLMVINKPAGLTVHPGAGNYQDTMVNALIAYCGKNLSGVGGVMRPGIVHRLDKDTSGLIAIAKNDLAHHSLAKQLAARMMKRTYTALIWGSINPLAGVIKTNIARSTINRKKMAVVKSGGKLAISHYKTAKIFGNNIASQIECNLETGRTHQIRVHFSHLGHALIGDQVYGSSKRKLFTTLPQDIQDLINDFKRQALHATKLAFSHPYSNEYMEFSAPIPEDMALLIDKFSRI